MPRNTDITPPTPASFILSPARLFTHAVRFLCVCVFLCVCLCLHVSLCVPVCLCVSVRSIDMLHNDVGYKFLK
jgi:hypothetical protein